LSFVVLQPANVVNISQPAPPALTTRQFFCDIRRPVAANCNNDIRRTAVISYDHPTPVASEKQTHIPPTSVA